MGKHKVAVAHGDGIGPEIMQATLKILEHAKAPLELHPIKIGEQVYLSGESSGMDPDAWATIEKCEALLKAPITTPQGGGYKSLNVTLRKSLNLYANVRPCMALSPYVPTHFPEMDLTIIRENEEDLYAGIEHRQTEQVVQCLKLISRPGCERIIRYAFEYAKIHGRKKVTCMSKDNIMKLTDGLFHEVFKEIASQYPEIVSDHCIIDIGSALLATNPERFDVIVTSNLYGDIISDIAAQITGSVGMGGSANVGEHFAMFEAIHGSAPDIAGKDMANPSGLLEGAVLMLLHLGEAKIATTIQNAWLTTLEQGMHTGDIFSEEKSRKKIGTREFAEAVCANLGRSPETLQAVAYPEDAPKQDLSFSYQWRRPEKQIVGVDVFIDDSECSAEELGKKLSEVQAKLKIKMITNRGLKVWPAGLRQTFCTDHWRCRFQVLSAPGELKEAPSAIVYADVIELLTKLESKGHDVIKTENLYEFDGERGYSLGQGE